MHLTELAVLFLAVAATLPSAIAAPDQCGSIRQRKEIRNMSDSERTAYINAVKRLQAAQQPNVYDHFAKTHYEARMTAHGYAWFYSWHRAFLRAFEKELQKVDRNIMLPYWNWAYDSQAPETSPVITWFGGNGRASDRCVDTGSFAGWKPFYPQPHCLPRSWNGGSRLLSFTGPEALESISNAATTYNSFRLNIEGSPHGQVHVAIGGDMGGMHSPNDPIFYLHHAFVDKIWADWQAKGNNLNKYDGNNADGSPAKITDRLSPFPYVVSDLLNTRNLCYTYAPFNPPAAAVQTANLVARAVPETANNTTASSPNDKVVVGAVSNQSNFVAPTPPKSSDRTELIALRSPEPLPNEWILSNHQNVEQVRQIEATLSKLVSQLNTVPGYVSPAAPIRQPRVLAILASNNAKLTATKAGHKVDIQVKDSRLSTEDAQKVASQVNTKLGTSPDQSAANKERAEALLKSAAINN